MLRSKQVLWWKHFPPFPHCARNLHSVSPSRSIFCPSPLVSTPEVDLCWPTAEANVPIQATQTHVSAKAKVRINLEKWHDDQGSSLRRNTVQNTYWRSFTFSLLSLYVWYNNILHQQSEVSDHWLSGPKWILGFEVNYYFKGEMQHSWAFKFYYGQVCKSAFPIQLLLITYIT